MNTPSPADEIRAAAQLLHDRAQAATSGPWRTADWIALADPVVGLALADLLADQADGDDHGVVNPWALAVARAVLRGEPAR